MNIKSWLKNLPDNKKALKIIRITGNILCILSFIFIIQFIIRSDFDFSVFLKPYIFIAVILTGLVVAFSVYISALAWKKNLSMFTSQKISTVRIAYIYSRANLSKYIPGNVMHFVSRNILGSDLKLSQKDMGLSSVFEVLLQIIVIFAFVIITAAGTFFSTIQTAIQNGQLDLFLFVLILAVLVIVIVLAAVYIIRRRKSLSLRPQNLLISCLYYLVFCILNGLAFAIVIYFTQNGLGSYDIFTISGYYMLAWFLGFITPGAPSGLGIREYVLIVLFTPAYPQSEVLSMIIIMRMVSILGDVFLFLIVSIVNNILKRKQDSSIDIGGF